MTKEGIAEMHNGGRYLAASEIHDFSDVNLSAMNPPGIKIQNPVPGSGFYIASHQGATAYIFEKPFPASRSIFVIGFYGDRIIANQIHGLAENAVLDQIGLEEDAGLGQILYKKGSGRNASGGEVALRYARSLSQEIVDFYTNNGHTVFQRNCTRSAVGTSFTSYKPINLDELRASYSNATQIGLEEFRIPYNGLDTFIKMRSRSAMTGTYDIVTLGEQGPEMIIVHGTIAFHLKNEGNSTSIDAVPFLKSGPDLTERIKLCLQSKHSAN
jgi:hypothetical protein